MNINGRDVDLVKLCLAINDNEHTVSEAEVDLAEEAAEVLSQTRKRWPDETAPPDEVARDLSHVGWLVYVASWEILQTVPTNWARAQGELGRRAEVTMELLRRLDRAARLLPWPEWAPRALGAYRCHALGLSKKDTVESYREAWSLHDQADGMYKDWVNTVAQDRKLTRALKSVQVQLQLAATGTSCREPEQIVIGWRVPDDGGDTDDVGADEEDAFLRMFGALELGAARGNDAIGLLNELDGAQPLGHKVDEEELLTRSNYRNPGIMTARAHLIMLPMTALMQAWDQPPIRGHRTWSAARDDLLSDAMKAYRTIERELDERFRDDHLRQVVQLRLTMCFLARGQVLGSHIAQIGDLPAKLDDDALPELCAWLRAGGHDANIIGSAIMPSYLAGLRLLIGAGNFDRYVWWREQHIELDREVRNDSSLRAIRLADFRRAVVRSMRIA